MKTATTSHRPLTILLVMRASLLSEHLDLVQQVAAGALHVVLQLVQVAHDALFTGHAAPVEWYKTEQSR